MGEQGYTTKSGKPPWRESKYQDGMPETAYEVLAAGGSITKVAATLGVARSTVHEWMKQHPDFSDAIEAGLAVSESLWEDPSFCPDYHPIRWKLNMARRFGWTEKSETALTGANGGPIEYRNVQDMSDDELARIAAGTSE